MGYIVKSYIQQYINNLHCEITDAAHTSKPVATTKCINVRRSILILKQLYYYYCYFPLTPVGKFHFLHS